MNVAFLANRYGTVGGTERNLYELTRHFVSFGHEVHVYSFGVRCEPEKGLVMHRIPAIGIGRAANLYSYGVLGPRLAYRGHHDLVISFARSVRQDIVRNGGGTHPHFLEQIIAEEGPLKRMIRKWDPYHRSMLSIERKQYSRGNYRKVVAIAKTVKQQLIDTYGLPDNDVRVIYNGVDTTLFNRESAKEARDRIRAEFDIPPKAPTVIFMGNGFKRKGLDYLLPAVARHKDAGLYTLVVGEDPSMRAYKEMASQLGIADRVRFAGARNRPYDYYGAADFFALPSLYEPFGHSTLEALACGLPVIGARRAGSVEVLSGGLEEFAVEDTSDVDMLSECVGRLLDASRWAELSDRAVEIGEAHSIKANALAFEALCEEVLEEKKSSGGDGQFR